MAGRIALFFTALLFFTGCENIFTTNILSELKEEPENLSGEALSEYAQGLLSGDEDIDPEVLEAVVTKLEETRITPEEVKENPQLKEQFIEETTLLIDLKLEKANAEEIIETAIAGPLDGGSENIVEDLLNDSERIEELSSAADLIAEAYEADPESVTGTQKIIGSVGLVSDIIKDEEKKEKLESLPDLEPETIEASDFSEEDKAKIETASQMLEGAGDDLPPEFADMLEGFVF